MPDSPGGGFQLDFDAGCETISLTQGEYLQKANELSESAVTGVVLRIGSPYFDELTKAGFDVADKAGAAGGTFGTLVGIKRA